MQKLTPEQREEVNALLERLETEAESVLFELVGSRDELKEICARPIPVKKEVCADVANRAFGEAFGVDWVYAR